MISLDLGGRTAVIMGGAGAPGRGMGAAMSTAFAEAGANVVVVDISAERAAETVETIRAVGGTAISVQADVSSGEDVRRVAETANAEFGVVDILVNHVGIGNHLPLLETTDDWWERSMAVNARAPFLASRQFLPAMLEQGKGVILNTISICGFTGGRAGPAYVAAKHAVVGLTQNIAACYADQGIRCNGMAPGSVRGDGPEWNSVEGRPRRPDETVELWPALRKGLDLSPRKGRPEEMAPIMVFLASDHASFINGAIIPVDGGWTAI